MDLLVAGPCINAATETAVSNAVGDYLDVVAEQRSGLSSGLSPVTDEATSFSSLDLLSQAVQHELRQLCVSNEELSQSTRERSPNRFPTQKTIGAIAQVCCELDADPCAFCWIATEQEALMVLHDLQVQLRARDGETLIAMIANGLDENGEGTSQQGSSLQETSAMRHSGLVPPTMANLEKSIVDLKGLFRPASFSGRETEWAEWCFKQETLFNLLGLGKTMKVTASAQQVEVEHVEEAWQPTSQLVYGLLAQTCQGRALNIVKNVVDANGFRAWWLLKREYEPLSDMRFVSMLVALLSPKWESTDSNTTFLDNLAQWERQVDHYELQSGDKIADKTKVAVIMRWCPVQVKDFIKLAPADTVSSYHTLRTAITAFVARGRVYGPDGTIESAMEIDTVGDYSRSFRGGDGKGSRDRGKGKGGLRPSEASNSISRATMHCSRCGRDGHLITSCFANLGSNNRDGGKSTKGSGKFSGFGKNSSKQFSGCCHRCGKTGHKKADCRAVMEVTSSVSELEPSASQIGASSMLAQILRVPKKEVLHLMTVLDPVDDDAILEVQHKGFAYIMVDSGSFEHVCPPTFATHIPILRSSADISAVTATGQSIKHYGKKTVVMAVGDGYASIDFEVLDVQRPILSVAKLLDHGWSVYFTAHPFVEKGSVRIGLERRGRAFVLPACVLGPEQTRVAK